jgi:Na+-transporting methylmalonyl-CoA/oxaloacetate decarboxylase gamma subunit
LLLSLLLLLVALVCRYLDPGAKEEVEEKEETKEKKEKVEVVVVVLLLGFFSGDRRSCCED